MLPEQLIALEGAALAAIGNPERRCQVAMADIYKRAGLLPEALEIPNGPRDASRWSSSSLIADFMATCPHFEEVAEMQPGDLIGFHVGHALHHVSILLSDGRLCHVYGAHGVQIAPCIPGPWLSRIAKVWRIVP